MAEAVPVRCPTCRRENSYSAPVFPCACGSPVVAPLNLAAPAVPLTRRTWSDSWVAVRCEACGRDGEWPRPEVGCGSCGTVALIPVHPPASGDPDAPDSGLGGRGTSGAGDGVRADARGPAATTDPLRRRTPRLRQASRRRRMPRPRRTSRPGTGRRSGR